jgi:hypothetical protein
MSKQRRRLLVAMCLLAVSAAGYRWFFGGWTVERVERLVRAEVKGGWTRAEVQVWLDAHGFGHCYQDIHGPFTEETIDAWGLKPLPGPGADRPLGPFQAAGIVESEMFPANVDWFWSGWMRIAFAFDGDGRAVGYAVDRFVNAP